LLQIAIKQNSKRFTMPRKLERIILTTSRHVLRITRQKYSLGREIVVPLYSLVDLIHTQTGDHHHHIFVY